MNMSINEYHSQAGSSSVLANHVAVLLTRCPINQTQSLTVQANHYHCHQNQQNHHCSFTMILIFN